MNKNKKFISTSDLETYKMLKGLGFQEVENSNGRWTFINDRKIVFSDNDVKNVNYTNILHF